MRDFLLLLIGACAGQLLTPLAVITVRAVEDRQRRRRRRRAARTAITDMRKNGGQPW